MSTVDPVNGVDGLTGPFASISRAALEGDTISLTNTSSLSPCPQDQATELQNSCWLTDANLTASSMGYVQPQPLVDNLPVSLVHPCSSTTEFNNVYGASVVNDAGAVGGSYLAIADRLKAITSIADGQDFRIVVVGRNSLAGGLKMNIRQQGRDYLDMATTDTWDAGATTNDLGISSGNVWETYTSPWFSVAPCSGASQGASPFLNTLIEFQLWKTGAGTGDCAFLSIQKRGSWSVYGGGLANTYRFPIGSRVESQYGVSLLYTSSTGVKDDIEDMTTPAGGTYTALAEGEWDYVHDTLSAEGGYLYYRLNLGETIGGMWFVPHYGSRSDSVITCQGSGDISNITTYGGVNRGISAITSGTDFTGSNINSFLAGASGIAARIDADFDVIEAVAGTDNRIGASHGKGFMGDRGGNLTITRGDTKSCYDNAYQVFNDGNLGVRLSTLTMNACRISGAFDLETLGGNGMGVNAESPTGGLGYNLNINHCLLSNVTGTTGNCLALKRVAGTCTVDIQDTVLTTDAAQAVTSVEASITVTGSGNRWGGDGAGGSLVVGAGAASFTATGEYVADINDQFQGSDPLSDISSVSSFIGLGSAVAFTDFYGRAYNDPSTLGAYAFISSGGPTLTTPYSTIQLAVGGSGTLNLGSNWSGASTFVISQLPSWAVQDGTTGNVNYTSACWGTEQSDVCIGDGIWDVQVQAIDSSGELTTEAHFYLRVGP